MGRQHIYVRQGDEALWQAFVAYVEQRPDRLARRTVSEVVVELVEAWLAAEGVVVPHRWQAKRGRPRKTLEDREVLLRQGVAEARRDVDTQQNDEDRLRASESTEEGGRSTLLQNAPTSKPDATEGHCSVEAEPGLVQDVEEESVDEFAEGFAFPAVEEDEEWDWEAVAGEEDVVDETAEEREAWAGGDSDWEAAV